MGFSKVWVTGGQIAELRTPLRRPCVSCAPFAFEAATANSRTQTFFVQLDDDCFLIPSDLEFGFEFLVRGHRQFRALCGSTREESTCESLLRVTFCFPKPSQIIVEFCAFRVFAVFLGLGGIGISRQSLWKLFDMTSASVVKRHQTLLPCVCHE